MQSNILNLTNHNSIQTHSQKLKNTKSHIRLPLPPLPIQFDSNKPKESQNKSNSLLISRPSFIGDLQTLTAYYQNENNLNKSVILTSTTKPKSILKVKNLSNKSNHQIEPNLIPHRTQQERSKSIYPIQSQSNRTQQERSKSTYPIQFQSNQSEDQLKPIQPIDFQPLNQTEVIENDEVPKLELPFLGLNQHIGCRFSIRTLTREVERSLKAHEPMPPKEYQEVQFKRYSNEHEKLSVLNRTRQDLGLSPRHQQTQLDSILESYLEEPNPNENEEDQNFQLDQMINENDDDQTKWTKVEKLLSRLPSKLPELKDDDHVNLSFEDSFKSVSSIKAPLNFNKSIQPIDLRKNEKGLKIDQGNHLDLRRSERPRMNEEGLKIDQGNHLDLRRSERPRMNEEGLKMDQGNHLDLRRSETPQRNHLIKTNEIKSSRKTIEGSPQDHKVTSSNLNQSLPIQSILVPQPWGRARDQRRQTQSITNHRITRSSEFNTLINSSSLSSSRNSKKMSKLDFKNKHLSSISKSIKNGIPDFLNHHNSTTIPPPLPVLPKKFIKEN